MADLSAYCCLSILNSVDDRADKLTAFVTIPKRGNFSFCLYLLSVLANGSESDVLPYLLSVSSTITIARFQLVPRLQ